MIDGLSINYRRANHLPSVALHLIFLEVENELESVASVFWEISYSSQPFVCS